MLFIDVDAACKLAHWNILPLLPELTGIPWSEMATVSSLKYRAQQAANKPDGKLFQSIEAAKTVVFAVEAMSPAGTPDPEMLALLSAIPQIDPGEAVLLALLARDTANKLLTGDKRAIRALAANAAAKHFEGRLICIEQILDNALRLNGRDWFLANVCPNRSIDKAVSMILGSRCDAQLEILNAGIQSYVNELIRLRDPSILVASNRSQ